MKHLPVAAALAVFLWIALALWLERPAPADASLFGAEVALVPELPPLAAPSGTLVLRGEVRTVAGDEAIDTLIALLRADDDSSEAEPLYHTYTDPAGLFELRHLAPGAYRVVLTHPSAQPKAFALELPAEGIPEDVRWVLAAPLPPLPSLPELRRASLEGRLRMPEVLADDDPAPQGFEVVLRPATDTPLLSGASERRATTDATGRFTLGDLVVASYDVEVLPEWARGGSWPVLARRSCAAGSDAALLELTLDVGALEGEVQEVEGRPLIGALVRVTALGAADPVGEPQTWPPAVTDAAGRFQIALLPPGRYLVHVRAGAAARDVEVVVESGRRTSVPIGALDPGAGAGTTGG